LICALNVLQVLGLPDNSHHSTPVCQLDNNQRGICKAAKNCEYVLELIKGKRYSEFSHCQFEGRTPIVCCPEGTSVSVKTTTTRAQAKPAPSYPKSTKFLTALCKYKHEIPDLNQNVVGGEPAGVGEFPFQVALGYKDHNNEIEYKCGGSLIADDIVITAAHCANRQDSIPVTVKLGRASLIPDEYDFGDGEDIEIQVKLISIYENLENNFYHIYSEYQVTSKIFKIFSSQWHCLN